MDFELDASLRVRMLATLAVIAIMPLAFTATMTLAYNYVIVPTGYIVGIPLARIGFDPRWIVVLTLVGIVIAYVRGGEDVLRSTAARRVSEEKHPDLHGRLSRLARTVDLPPPDVAVAQSPVPNAYAVGRSQGSATVAVTTGLLEELDDDELDAVLAHELAHVRNRDVAVMSVAYLLPTFTFVVSSVTYRMLSLFVRGLGHINLSDDDDARAVLALIALLVVTAVVTITVSMIFWGASSVLFLMLSQYREYAADRGAAAITGDPGALASALATIDDEMNALPDRDLRDLDGGAEALYISSLGLPMFTDDDDSLRNTLLSQELFPDSHPPTDERVERLRDLAADQETAS